MKKIAKQILIISFALLQIKTFVECALSYEQQINLMNKQVYSSLQVVQVDLNTICQTKQLKFIITLQQPYQNYFFALSDNCGLVLSQLQISTGDYKLIQSYPSIKNVSAIAYNYAQNTLWVADYSFAITIYDASNPQKLQALNQINSFTLSTQTIQFSYDNKQVFFLQAQGNIQIYLMQNLVFIQKFINTNNPASILVLPQQNLLILGGYNLYFYQIQNSSYDPTQPYQLGNSQQIITGDNTPKMYFVDNKYLFTWSTFTGLNHYDISGCIKTQKCDNTSVIMIATQKQLILGFQNIYLTKDTNYFIVFYNFYGIYIYDVSQRSGFAQYYSIQLTGLNTAMGISQDESFIVLTLDNSLNVYRQIPSNLNIQAPNILNTHQNTLFNQHVQSVRTFWHCTIDDNLNMVISNGANGAWLMNINPINYSINIVQHLTYPFSNNILDEPRFLSGLKYLALSPGYLIYFYSRSADLSQVTQLSIYTPPMNNAHIGCIRQSKDGNTLFVAGGQVGLIVIDISDINNPKHITAVYYTFPLAPNCQSKGISISNDEKYLYMTYRYLGVVIYDISDFHNPKQVNVVYTLGGEDVFLTDDNLNMVVVETIYGLSFWSLEPDRTKPIKQASLRTQGQAVHMRFLQSCSFILTTSLYKGQLFLIDYRDRTNPQLIQSYQYQGVEVTSGDVCVSPDESFSMMIFPYGVVYIPLRNPVVFHTDIIWLQDIPNSSMKKQILMNPVDSISKAQNLQVGMNVILKLSQLYSVNTVTLVNAFYYENQVMKPLPTWISISQNSLSAEVSVDKSAIDSSLIQSQVSKQGKGDGISSQVVIQNKLVFFQLSERISASDFVQSQIGISSSLSTQIFNDCIAYQIILDSGFINPNYSDNQIQSSLTSQVYTPQILEQIKFILRQKITNYPVQFNIQNSLFIDIYSQVKVITSYSSSVVVYFFVNSTVAQFVNKNYPAVLTSFSSNFDQIQIQGGIDSVNSVLLNGVKISNLTDPSQIQIKIQVSDGVNQDLYKQFVCGDTQIITLNSQTYKNPNLSLQDDFNRKFSQASVQILTKFDYQISSEVFLNKDSSNLVLSTLVMNHNGTYAPLNNQFWLSYDQNQKAFSGTPSSSEYNTIVNLKVVATDGYTTAEDLLEIHINAIPLSYVLTILFQILGPTLGLLGLWRYSSTLYNIINKKKHETSLVTVNAGEQIILQIPLIKDEMQIAKEIWGKFYKQLSKESFILALTKSKENYSRNRLHQNIQEKIAQNQQAFFKSIQSDQFIKSSQSQEQQNIMRLNALSPIKICTEEIESQLQNNSPTHMLDLTPQGIKNKLKLTQNDDKYLENSSQASQYKPVVSASKANKIQRQVTQLEKKQMKMSMMISQKYKQDEPKQAGDELNNSYFTQFGYLNKQYILDQVRIFLSTQKKIKNQEFVNNQLKEANSKLSCCIFGLASVQFAEFDESTKRIIEFLKSVADKSFSPQDWYKQYVFVQPCIELIQTQPFPTISINQQALNEALKIFNKEEANQAQKTNSSSSFQIFRPLIEDYLIACSYGFTFDTFYFIPHPIGECLQMQAHSLKCIEGYVPITNTSCMSLRKCLGLDYVQKEFIDNQKLNSWVQMIDISNNVILLKGLPQNKDVGRYLFKINDFYGYTIKRINIEVIYNKQLASQYKKNELTQKSTVIQEADFNIAEGSIQDEVQMMVSQYCNSTKNNSQNLQAIYQMSEKDELIE
ncbi:hypothetical protein TTHERM_00540390 (macronuclear) [Tetrahymena thermophila SB210]|uniref:Dystroglycan-type cadherin-like domain-containing protein n=1 Tax=Tetrahymena thermophila (strain SB210) TaxID=312017 RepID=I7M724_TETTS|nr:hypothetical protein TTHERM_00540390 [Tetrahymena thermophila SB210]EAR87719.1 hypothetical protein TTHERM_00540390 [Tetrahymena thermophila SB210]|eukprot:XP_001007964.1 hypothetical protein TTHERM_00540390 [Tetrahymena thermophila SB210]